MLSIKKWKSKDYSIYNEIQTVLQQIEYVKHLVVLS